jgi:S1-C subfamily serine protease
VAQVVRGTPAAHSGLKPEDIITAVDDTPIYDADGLVLSVGKLPPEAVAHLSVLRGGIPQTVEVALSKYAVRGRKIVTVTDPAWRGMRVEYPTAAVDQQGRVSSGMSFVDDAVFVAEVAEDSPAWEAGLRHGMFITQVDRTPVRSPKEFAAAVARNRGPLQLRILGDQQNPIRTVGPAS